MWPQFLGKQAGLIRQGLLYHVYYKERYHKESYLKGSYLKERDFNMVLSGGGRKIILNTY